MRIDEERRPAGNGAASTTTPSSHQYIAGLRRRRAATYRVEQLDCGCGTSDPWICRCTQPPLSDRAVDGWRDAATHVRAEGMTPALPIEVLRALYRRGGQDRALAEELHDAAGRLAS